MLQNLKFHIITLTSVTFLSFMSATTINLVLSNTLFKPRVENKLHAVGKTKNQERKKVADFQEILDSYFFEKVDPEELEVDSAPEKEGPSIITDLTLLGTITGPKSIARAIISKKGEKESQLVKIGQTVFGYTVTSITKTKVYLRSSSGKSILDMYPPEKKDNKTASTQKQTSTSGGGVSKQSISRAELNQMLKGSMDNMLKGLRAGPYRKNGEIVGYRLKRVSSGNILYKFGIRSGDILKRINGHPITSTKKLFELWEQFPKESRVVIDVERNKNIQTFDFTIND